MSSLAKKFKVYIAVENVWNKFLLSPLEMRKFIDEIGSEYVVSYFDVGNVLISGYPQDWIHILGKRIKKIHIKDFKTEIGNITGFVNLLEGDVNWQAVISALKEINYDNYVVAELMPPFKHYSEMLIKETSLKMDKILELS